MGRNCERREAVTEVYLDSFVLLNFLVNCLLLMCAGKLDGEPVHLGGCGLGAFLGTAYAVLSLLPQWGFLEHPVCKAAAAVFMLLTAYGRSERLLRIGGVFLVLACAFGGGLLLLCMLRGEPTVGAGVLGPSLGMRGILIAAALSYGCLSLLLRGEFSHAGPRGELVPLTLIREDRKVTLLALRDTGNTLRDPLTGHPVVVVEGEKIRDLLPELDGQDLTALSDPVALLEGLSAKVGMRFQLLPYRAVGVDCGLLLALRVDRVECRGWRRRNCLTALSPTPVSDGGNYSALIGAEG